MEQRVNPANACEYGVYYSKEWNGNPRAQYLQGMTS